MKFWLCEDLETTRRTFVEMLREEQCLVEVVFLTTSAAASEAIAQMADEDVVSLDSQLPAAPGGAMDVHAGIRLAATVRACGKACHLCWHSPAALPADLEPLGVRALSKTEIAALVARLSRGMAAGEMPAGAREQARALLGPLAGGSLQPSLITLDILCQGYLAVVGAADALQGRPGNEVVRELREDPDLGPPCLHNAARHEREARQVADWFREGVQEVQQAIRRHGGSAEAYWASLSAPPAGDADAVRSVRTLFERLEAAGTPGTEGDNWDQWVQEAHRGFRRLAQRGYL
jgi:CheY-like chemotaxis protein